MNILFITRNSVDPFRGGTERITYTLACNFKDCGLNCYTAYLSGNQNNDEKSPFLKNIKLNRFSLSKKLFSIINKYNINIVIVQGEFQIASKIRKAIQNTSCKIVFVHHFEPGYEINFIRFKASFIGIKISSVRDFYESMMRVITIPVRIINALNNKRNYKLAYKVANNMVLLSKRFIPEFKEYAKLKSTDKIVVIPNALSFNNFASPKDISKKEKIVLIVSRLEETPKRIFEAIKIWRDLTNRYPEIIKEWRLIILGDGPEKSRYHKYVKTNDINAIEFHGKQDPKKFYLNSSIFMMTSASEGWGLTLTEAQQYGCVPIAYQTYSSIHDIIEPLKSGILIPEKDRNKYVESLHTLMNNDELRIELAHNCIEEVRKYNIDKVIPQWLSLFNKLN